VAVPGTGAAVGGRGDGFRQEGRNPPKMCDHVRRGRGGLAATNFPTMTVSDGDQNHVSTAAVAATSMADP